MIIGSLYHQYYIYQSYQLQNLNLLQDWWSDIVKQDPKVFWFRRVSGDFQTIFSDFIVLRLILSSISISKSSSISKYSLILILSLISKSSSYVRTRDAIASKNLEILWMYETLTAESWCGWDIGPQFEILMNQKLLPNIFSALTFGSALWTV